MAFKIGDTVKVKSGRPAMTVASVIASKVNCVWFDGTDQKSGQFLDQMLELFAKQVGVSAEPRR